MMKDSRILPRRRPGPWWAAALLLALLAVPARAESADGPPVPAQGWLAQARAKLRGRTLTLGAGYLQGTTKLGTSDTPPGRSQQTDNGGLEFLLDFSGGDHLLKLWPMRTGQALLGWDISATAGQFKTNRQLIGSAVHGVDMGTSVQGEYLGAAPSLFLRIGPLWEDRPIYCTFTFGVGAAALRYHGTALFGDAPGQALAVGGNHLRPAIYDKATWQFQVGSWIVEFDSKYFLAHDPSVSPATYEAYGMGLAYQINL